MLMRDVVAEYSERSLNSALPAIGDAESVVRDIARSGGRLRGLAGARPEAFIPALAMSLGRFGVRLTDLERHEQALRADREAAALGAQRYGQDPDRFTEPLQQALANLAVDLRHLGRSEAEIDEEIGHCLVSRPSSRVDAERGWRLTGP
jgi:hypothetical protein